MSTNFRITPRAEDDLKNIGRYTFQKWGKEQRNRYLRDLDNRFRGLADHPKIGKHRSDIKDGYYCYLQGSHLVFYTINENTINIIGIPHKAMDILNYFSAQDL